MLAFSWATHWHCQPLPARVHYVSCYFVFYFLLNSLFLLSFCFICGSFVFIFCFELASYEMSSEIHIRAQSVRYAQLSSDERINILIFSGLLSNNHVLSPQYCRILCGMFPIQSFHHILHSTYWNSVSPVNVCMGTNVMQCNAICCNLEILHGRLFPISAALNTTVNVKHRNHILWICYAFKIHIGWTNKT